MHSEEWLFVSSLLLLLSIFAWKISSRLGNPALVLFLGIGMRGAVPIVLATFPLLAGVSRVPLLFDLVFFVVLASVLLQGAMAPLVTKWLGVVQPT